MVLTGLRGFGLGVGSGALLSYWLWPQGRKDAEMSGLAYKFPLPECAAWDDNWDFRSPKCVVKPLPADPSPEAQNSYNEALLKAKPKAHRHLILIRHGQYNHMGKDDSECYLTPLGKKQAEWTGKRLSQMDIGLSEIIISTMTRAQETGKIIAGFSQKVPTSDCNFLREGAPIMPVPSFSTSNWRPEKYRFHQDGARIEAAFRKYFYRAPPDQKVDSYTLLVCHANVIRYFVCRALQLPPEAWLRLSLNHGSITWIAVRPNGRVVLKTLGETGHMPPEDISREIVAYCKVGKSILQSVKDTFTELN